MNYEKISLPCPTTGGSPSLKWQRFSLAFTGGYKYRANARKTNLRRQWHS